MIADASSRRTLVAPLCLARLLVLAVVLLATARIATFAFSPEGWSQLSLLDSRGFLGSLAPLPEYPYWRPVWFAYLKLVAWTGVAGGMAHIPVLILHACTSLLILQVLTIAGATRWTAIVTATLCGITPGAVGALAWLAAGNKIFVAFFLALGVVTILRARSWRSCLAGTLGCAVLAIGSAENAYLCAVLFPATVLVKFAHAPNAPRIAQATGLGVLCLAVGLTHLAWSTQSTMNTDGRVGQLIAAIGSDPAHWARSVLGNLGRYFLHALGIADNAPRAGAIALALLAVVAVSLRRASIALALALFVILNVPASLFPGESSRHHAYLPAIGAVSIAVSILRLLPAKTWLASALGLWFVVGGWRGQSLWERYLSRADAVYTSAQALIPEVSHASHVMLLNVPMEYGAAFHKLLGDTADIDKWQHWTIPTTRSSGLYPRGFTSSLSDETVLIEYDGTRLRRVTQKQLATRTRAPQAWLAARVEPFDDPVLAWSEILASTLPIDRLWKGSTRASRSGKAPPQGSVRVLAHGFAPGPRVYWDIDARLGSAAWVVLGWTPRILPATENAWLFTLAPLPWLFEVRVRDRETKRRVAPPIHPVLGWLPAVWLEPGIHHLRVEMGFRTK